MHRLDMSDKINPEDLKSHAITILKIIGFSQIEKDIWGREEPLTRLEEKKLKKVISFRYFRIDVPGMVNEI